MTTMYPQNEAVPGNDPTLRKYAFKAKVKTKRKSWKQGFFGGQTEFNAVLLIPQESDMTTLFYAAWLPETSDEHSEVILEMGHPIYGTCRGAVMRRSKNFDKPHIFVMSKGVEEILQGKDGLVIENITALPADQDEMGDGAVDSSKDITKFRW